MDSYAGLCRAPLPAPAATAMHINQRRETSALSPSERETEGGHETGALSKRPGVHISWHITDVLPQLSRQLIRTFMKGERRDGREEKRRENRGVFLI